ncbi:hypothetical protein SGL43_01735 [Streptomyces globisporus]|uniref:Uncharacterized protein n=1 Tax=Streptomyces globisporus TaxID=1908 RepID=A0ABM9GVR2_STRGL|nr:hypothetical protein SGL43_01735 [Streptomyces globisporus]
MMANINRSSRLLLMQNTWEIRPSGAAFATVGEDACPQPLG